MKKFALAIAALLAVAFGVEACNNVRVSSCNQAQVQVQTFAVVPQVQTFFVPVTTFAVQQVVPVQTFAVQSCQSAAVVQQQAFVQQAVVSNVQTFAAAAVVAPAVNVNVAVKGRGRLFGNRSVVRQRQVIRQR